MDERMDALLGAYALDAVDEYERRQVEEYLATEPRARAEVEAHREVATLLAYSGAAAPAGLWDRISRALDGEAETLSPPPVERVVAALPPPAPPPARVAPDAPIAPVVALRRRGRLLPASIAAALALALGVAGGVLVERDRTGGTGPSASVDAVFAQALADPVGRQVQLLSASGPGAVRVVLMPDGSGYLDGSSLGSLPLGETYQLWAVTASGRVISVGVLGNRPGIEGFAVGEPPSALVITHERRAEGVEKSAEPAAFVGELN
jgi:anti-sigma factor RsiW